MGCFYCYLQICPTEISDFWFLFPLVGKMFSFFKSRSLFITSSTWVLIFAHTKSPGSGITDLFFRLIQGLFSVILSFKGSTNVYLSLTFLIC